MQLQSDERMLLVGMFSAEQVRAFATQLSNGILCALVPVENVADLRRELRDLNNILVVPEDPDGHVPWVDGYFSVVLAAGSEATAEMQRALCATGKFVRSDVVRS
jgi:hypothetical protein